MNPASPGALADPDEVPSPDAGPSAEGDVFRTMLDAIDVRISLFDRHDRLVFLNAASLRGLDRLDLDRSRIIGSRRADLNRFMLDRGLIDAAQFDRLNGRDPQLDMEIAGRRWMTIRRFPLPDGGLVVVISDVTHVRRAEQILADEQRLSTVGSLVAGIAHEINTPLGVAVTAASYLRDAVTRAQVALRAGALTAEEAERTLSGFADVASLILSNLDRSADLVRGFKLLAVEPAGDHQRRIPIRRHLNAVAVMLMPEARRRGHALLVDCPTDVEVETCPAALTQVLANLVVNSLHHAFEDRPGGTILVSVLREDGRVRIVVGDNGVGVGPAAQRRIFDPFYTTRRGQGGRGLGLSIVHNLVTGSLAGTIETEGAPGEGLRQIVTIPLACPSEPFDTVRTDACCDRV